MVSPTPITSLGLQLSGYSFPGVADRNLGEHVLAIAKTAEKSGFDSLWTMDHLQQIDTVGPSEDPILEAYTTLAAIAAVTRSSRVGVLVSAVGFRNPALLAKMVTTIDILSGGRAVLGIGAGWFAEEYHAYGALFPSLGLRYDQLEEAVKICRSMFRSERPDVEGHHYTVRAPLNVPGPLRPGGPPVLIGGGGEKRLIPIVARFADACSFFGGPATVKRKLDVLARACEDIGRDPATITKTWLGAAVVASSEHELQPRLERLGQRLGVRPSATKSFNLCGLPSEVESQVARFRSAGLDGLIVTIPDLEDLEQVEHTGAILRRATDG